MNVMTNTRNRKEKMKPERKKRRKVESKKKEKKRRKVVVNRDHNCGRKQKAMTLNPLKERGREEVSNSGWTRKNGGTEHWAVGSGQWARNML